MNYQNRQRETLTSKIVKILRITNEPLSAHAINKTYKYPYKEVQVVLAKLEEDGMVKSLKAKGGTFYFIPDKYFDRDMSLDSEEAIPFIWLEDLTIEELNVRKGTILEKIDELKFLFENKTIKNMDYFQRLQKRNEELLLINQIITDRKTKSQKHCIHCDTELEDDKQTCPACNKELPQCIVCKQIIYNNEEYEVCEHCEKMAHVVHLKEWVKAFGHCPNCKKPLKHL